MRSSDSVHRRKTFDDYAADPLLRSAVERQFEIIGEALRVAVHHRPDLAKSITDVPAIIAFRNQLTHAYSAVDHSTVWGILERRMPLLQREVTLLLNESADNHNNSAGRADSGD